MEAKMKVADVYNITGVGPVVVGCVTEGLLLKGMKTSVSGKVMTIKSMEMQHKSLSQANVGDNLGMAFSGGDYNLLKSCKDKELIFSGEATESTAEKRDNSPKVGFFQSLFRRF
jgi:translation elongation factor EF-1alpha